MNWKIIYALAPAGLLMGVLSVMGLTQYIEPFLWLVLGLAGAWIISKKNHGKIFLTGFVTGVVWGLLNAILQSLFFETYCGNNPVYQEQFEQIDFMNARYFPLITGPLTGMIMGVVIGALALLYRKVKWS